MATQPNLKSITPSHTDSALLGNALSAGNTSPSVSAGPLPCADTGSGPASAPGRGAAEPRNDLIHVGASQHFWNKENRAPRKLCRKHTEMARRDDPNAPEVYDGCWAFSKFGTRTLKPEQLVGHILSGFAWIPSTFGGAGRRTNENWQQAELIAVDYDDNVSVADCLNVPLIREHALLVHPSASSSASTYKTRVIFRFDTPITGDPERYRLSTMGLSRLLGLPEDACSYKPAQLFYGSTNRIEQPHYNLEARLPLALIDEQVERLQAEAAEQRAAAEQRRIERNYQPVDRNSDRATRRIARLLERAYEKTRSAPSDRTKAAYGQAFHLARYLAYWSITEYDIEQTLLDALRANGAHAKYGQGECLRHIHNGIEDGKQDVPEPLELPEKKPITRTSNSHKRDQQIVSPDYAQAEVVQNSAEPTPGICEQPRLSLWQMALLMIVCPEAGLIYQAAYEVAVDDITVGQVADWCGKSQATAQRWVDKCLQWGFLQSRFSSGMTRIEVEDSLVRLNEKRQLHGAAVARTYRLTPLQGLANLTEAQLADFVQELMDRGEPDTIRRDEALDAGLDEERSARLELVTEETARTVNAFEVSAKIERAARQKARDLMRFAEMDNTPFDPDKVANTLSELRTQLIEALIATRPDEEWLHSELMWVAGVKRNSVSKLIKASTKLVAADCPTYVEVKLDGKDAHRSVQASCREKKGSPVAWLDAKGQVIQSFSWAVPAGAKGALLNVGKKYLRRAELPKQPVEVEPKEPVETPVEATPAPEPTEDELVQRDQQRARRAMLPRQRGLMEARGWKFIPGPFGYWLRGRQTAPNTWEGMTEALLLDVEWAEAQRITREFANDPLLMTGIELGAVITPLREATHA